MRYRICLGTVYLQNRFLLQETVVNKLVKPCSQEFASVSQLNPVYAIRSYIFNVNFSIVLASTPRSLSELLLSGVPNKILYACVLNTPPISSPLI
jgi:hypothetical protein